MTVPPHNKLAKIAEFMVHLAAVVVYGLGKDDRQTRATRFASTMVRSMKKCVHANRWSNLQQVYLSVCCSVIVSLLKKGYFLLSGIVLINAHTDALACPF